MSKRKAEEMSLRLPLVIILGATGSGKTKLSLDLAKKFCGEIIGADSMQIYKKLDIISAKPTKEERSVAPHHMIDKLSPNEVCTVVEYRNEAINIIDKLFAENKLPIVVGGTNYYIESLLWNILLEKPGEELKTKPWEYRKGNPNVTSEELHEKLKVLDPEMADKLHPNNKRKIIRALEVLEEKGRKVSEILKEQQTTNGGNSQGGGLRYKNTIIFWLQWDQTTLDERINKRVDSMIEEGLVDELLSFQEEFQSKTKDLIPDYTTGIYQMIGLKEFHDHLMMSPNQRSTPEGQKAFENGVEVLKRVTRRYARKQIRWIRNRFLGRSDREVPPLYALKADSVEQWDANITTPAIKIVANFISETPNIEFKPEPKCDIKSSANSQDETFVCDVCERIFIGSFQWGMHLKSRKHKMGLLRAAKAERLGKVATNNKNEDCC